MHHIYHTEGLILGSKNFGEAEKYYYIFTRELGMVYASASGVRKMSSKLRFVLQDFAYVHVDLVQGHEFWRITSASKTDELGAFARNGEAVEIYAQIAYLLRRLLAGVEAHSALFDDVLQGLRLLEKFSTREELKNAEMVIVLRILHKLGYVSGGVALEAILQAPLTEELIHGASEKRTHIVREINKALKETQL